MSFLDNLESNLKSLESREERGEQLSRDARQRDAERARVQASAVYAEQLKKGPYTAELLKQVTRLGYATRTKVQIAWLGANLRLEARGHRLELRPTPEGVVAVFLENNAEVRTAPVDLAGNPEEAGSRMAGQGKSSRGLSPFGLQAAPQIPGRHRAVGMPSLAQRFDFSRIRQFRKPVCFANRRADPQVADG